MAAIREGYITRYHEIHTVLPWNSTFSRCIFISQYEYSTSNLQSKHSTVPPPKTQERQPSPANLSPVDRPQTPSSTHPPIVYETSTAPIIFLNGKGPDFGIDVPNRGGVSTHPPLIHRGKRATTSSGDKNADNGPGRCHWAIIGCCEGSSVFTATTNECLDSLGCPGPYWDVHPCSIVGAAIQSTVTQYIDKKQE
ncbi:hypothetical protein Trydic_g10200 [Trypoxylus dichotomus]